MHKDIHIPYISYESSRKNKHAHPKTLFQKKAQLFNHAGLWNFHRGHVHQMMRG